MKNICHVVMLCNGRYDDAYTIPIKVFLDREKAEEYINKLKNEISIIDEKFKKTYPPSALSSLKDDKELYLMGEVASNLGKDDIDCFYFSGPKSLSVYLQDNIEIE